MHKNASLPAGTPSGRLAESVAADAGVHHLIDVRRRAIRGVAVQHQVRGLRWWPPTVNPIWLDFVLEELPDGLPAFRADLEAALGCRVAVYLAEQIPPEAWGRILLETVPL